MEKLQPIAKMASEKISEYSRVRLISHNDADGITAAAVMCHALLREDIVFHASIVSRLDENVVETVNNSTDNDDLVLFCDMGSGQPELIEKVKNDTIIIDHHAPVGETTAYVMVNPHLADIDGAYYMGASTTAYVVATEMNPENKEL
ncbi:MAG: DHH family phosphoesterase, partial [Methanohalophilus sp.]